MANKNSKKSSNKGLNYGNVSELYCVLKTVISCQIINPEMGNRYIALLDSPSTGMIWVERDETQKTLSIKRLKYCEVKKMFSVITENKYGLQSIEILLAGCKNFLLQLSKEKTASVQLSEDFLSLLKLFDFCAKLSSSEQKNDMKVVLSTEFDVTKMSFVTYGDWENVSIKSWGKSDPTLVNASSHMYVEAEVRVAPNESWVQKYLQPHNKLSIQNFIKDCDKNDVVLDQFESCPFIKENVSLNCATRLAKEAIYSHRPKLKSSKEPRYFKDIFKEKGVDSQIRLLLKYCMLGATPTNKIDTDVMSGFLMYEKGGDVFAEKFDSSKLGTFLIEMSYFEKPSLGRHTPNRDHVFLKIEDQKVILRCPLQIRLKLSNLFIKFCEGEISKTIKNKKKK